MTAPFLSGVLGAFVAGSSFADLPEALRHEGKRALLNYAGCALGAAGDPVVGAAVGVMTPFTGPERVTVIGRSERLDMMGASFANAIAANLFDYDDTHWATAAHPTGPVASAVLALAERRGLSGQDALHALILGAEVECRMALAVSPGHYNRGLHITSTCGVFGSAAACARLLGLDAAGIATSIGLATSQSAGTVENLSTCGKNLSVGNAARGGLLAALLAEAGYTAAPAAIEGPFGWANAFGDTLKSEAITDGLGERWELAGLAYKPYPAGFVFHAVIDAALELRGRLGPAAAIAEVVVSGNQLLLDRGDRIVATPRDAQVSLQHAAAVGLLRGRAGVEDFGPAAVSDPALAALRDRVRGELDASLPTGAARVTATTADGRPQCVTVLHARGSPGAPMSDADLEAKFLSHAKAAPERDKDRIAGLWSLETAPTVAPLMRLLAG